MNLLDKYVMAVGKHLPGKNRSDIVAELRSTLEDMLEDRSQQSGQPVDDALTAELLKEYGSPDKVAAGYTPTRYLIGPRLYPIFELVVKVVIAVVFGVSLFAFALGYASNPVGPGFIYAVGSFLLQIGMGLVTAFGNIVIVFAILERTLPPSEYEKELADQEAWDPASLNREPDPDKVSIAELIFEILFTVAGLVVFNLYPQIIGIGFITDGEWVFIPALSEAFFSYLPWINLLGALQIVLSLVLLRQGTWQTITRIFGIAIDLAGIALAFAMLTGPSLVAISGAALAGTPISAAWGVMQRLFSVLPQIVLTILIIVQGIEVGKVIYRLLKPTAIPIQLPK